MEKVKITDEREAARLAKHLSDNLYYEDNFTAVTFAVFCRNLPPIVQAVSIVNSTFSHDESFLNFSSICWITLPTLRKVCLILKTSWFLKTFLPWNKKMYMVSQETTRMYLPKPQNSVLCDAGISEEEEPVATGVAESESPIEGSALHN